jgi:hypothetical protein
MGKGVTPDTTRLVAATRNASSIEDVALRARLRLHLGHSFMSSWRGHCERNHGRHGLRGDTARDAKSEVEGLKRRNKVATERRLEVAHAGIEIARSFRPGLFLGESIRDAFVRGE